MRTFFLGLKTIDCFHESPLMQAQQCQLKTTTMLIKATQHCCIFFTPKKWFRDNLLGVFLSLLLFFTMSDRHFYTYWVKLVYKHIYSFCITLYKIRIDGRKWYLHICIIVKTKKFIKYLGQRCNGFIAVCLPQRHNMLINWNI